MMDMTFLEVFFSGVLITYLLKNFRVIYKRITKLKARLNNKAFEVNFSSTEKSLILKIEVKK